MRRARPLLRKLLRELTSKHLASFAVGGGAALFFHRSTVFPIPETT
ncbi:MAG TPA: hypothetical protein VMM18_08425 [Gemmatimonadaceae bacterium]|nr:hypothetical protein [Gemmatimonadaceae bacterium]